MKSKEKEFVLMISFYLHNYYKKLSDKFHPMNIKENENSTTKEQYFWNFIFTLFFLVLAVFSAYFLKSQGKIFLDVPVFDFILLLFATFRLIRLFVYDSVTNYIRDFFRKFKSGPGKTVFNIISCPWCTGVWIALAVSFFYFLAPFSRYFLLIIALSAIGSFIQVTINRIAR